MFSWLTHDNVKMFSLHSPEMEFRQRITTFRCIHRLEASGMDEHMVIFRLPIGHGSDWFDFRFRLACPTATKSKYWTC
jgi:hypothetical protein